MDQSTKKPKNSVVPKLTKEQRRLRAYDNPFPFSLFQVPWSEPLKYPPGLKREVLDQKEIRWADLANLDGSKFLNDDLVIFGIRYAMDNCKLPAEKIYAFNNFFYTSLTQYVDRAGTQRTGFNFEGVKKWTKKVDLFQKDYIIIPINESSHWYTAVICNLSAVTFQALPANSSMMSGEERDVKAPQENGVSRPKKPLIFILDSIGGRRDTACSFLQEYVKAEAIDKHGRELKETPLAIHASLPRQRNGCDCGLYAIAYVQQILTNPIEMVEKMAAQENIDEWEDLHPTQIRHKFRTVVLNEWRKQHSVEQLDDKWLTKKVNQLYP